MKTKTRKDIEIYEPRPHQPIVNYSRQEIMYERSLVQKIGVHRILILVMLAMFMFAYAGVDIGILLGVAIPGVVLVYGCNEIWKRHGQWYAFWIGCFAAAVYSFTWGWDVINFMAYLFASVQKVSIAGMIVTGVLFLMTLKK